MTGAAEQSPSDLNHDSTSADRGLSLAEALGGLTGVLGGAIAGPAVANEIKSYYEADYLRTHHISAAKSHSPAVEKGLKNAGLNEGTIGLAGTFVVVVLAGLTLGNGIRRISHKLR